jgi:glutathione S-transferase
MNLALQWRDALVAARSARSSGRSAELHRIDGRRRTAESELATIREQQQKVSELPTLREKAAMLVLELRQSTEELDTLREHTADLLDQLMRLVQTRCRTWLTNNDITSVDVAFAAVPEVFATDFALSGVALGSAAQYEASLPALMSAVAARREQLVAMVRRISARNAAITEQEQEDERRAAAARTVQSDADAVEVRLSRHVVPGESALPVAESLRTADLRLVANVHKQVLTPMLADLQFERANGLYVTDPLDGLTKDLTPS